MENCKCLECNKEEVFGYGEVPGCYEFDFCEDCWSDVSEKDKEYFIEEREKDGWFD